MQIKATVSYHLIQDWKGYHEEDQRSKFED